MKLNSVKDRPQQHIKSVLFFHNMGSISLTKPFYQADTSVICYSWLTHRHSSQERRWIWHLITLGSILQNTENMYGEDLPAFGRAYWQRLIWTKDFIIQHLSIQTFQYHRIHITCLTFLHSLYILWDIAVYTIKSYVLLATFPSQYFLSYCFYQWY